MLHNSEIAIPRHILDISETFWDDYRLDDLDPIEKLAFIEAVYPEYLSEANLEEKPLWTPYNEMQRRVLISDAFEMFCGGAGGTGKTDSLLGVPILGHKDAIIFRQEYPQMEELEKRSREILSGTGATYNASPSSKMWQKLPGDRTLKFGAIKFDKDVDKYMGRAHDFLGFDEITTFKESHYLSLFGWARSEDVNQRVRILCTGNPPDPSKPEQAWVKRRWAAWVDEKHPDPAKPGELRWYVNLDGTDTPVEGPDAEVYDGKGLKLKPLSRTFIPGEMLDFYKDGNYEATLQALPEPLRSRLLFGDFSQSVRDQEHQVIPTEWVLAAQERWEQMSPPETPLTAVGVDVARGGKNQTVISKRFDNYFAPLLKVPGEETSTGFTIGQYLIEALSLEKGDLSDVPLVFDLGGVGASPFDILMDFGFKLDGFNGASASDFRDRSGRLGFVNRRAEAWWKLREALDPESEESLALPPDPELLGDLTAPRWELTSRGIQIEKKEDLSKRLGRSPDCGDAVVMNYNSVIRGEPLYF